MAGLTAMAATGMTGMTAAGSASACMPYAGTRPHFPPRPPALNEAEFQRMLDDFGKKDMATRPYIGRMFKHHPLAHCSAFINSLLYRQLATDKTAKDLLGYLNQLDKRKTGNSSDDDNPIVHSKNFIQEMLDKQPAQLEKWRRDFKKADEDEKKAEEFVMIAKKRKRDLTVYLENAERHKNMLKKAMECFERV
jgi:hypothetical protein